MMDCCSILSGFILWCLFLCSLVRSYDSHSPAKIVQPPLDTKAISGESVLFFCRAEGNPNPRILFRWNDQELVHSRPGLQLKMIAPDSLSLRAKLEMEHNGDTITCFAQNQVGSDAATAQITVYSANETPPQGFPKVHQDPSATISQVGSSAHLQCEVSADPRPTVSWIKDQFYPVDLSISRFRLVNSGTLVIDTLLETDSGSYECMAQNSVGTVLSNAGHLHVRHNLTIAYHFLEQQGIQFPPNINEMPEKVDVAPGQGTNLTCRAGGFPVPMVWWSTLGSPAGPSNLGPVIRAERPLTEPQPHEATLRLTDITESYDYNCIAKNDLGLVRRNVSVVVKELPAPPTGLDARPIGATFAVMRWHKSTTPSVDSYTLSVETKDHKFGKLGRRQVANIDPSSTAEQDPTLGTFGSYVSYNLSDLTPYTEYIARVHSVSRSAGLSLPSDQVSFRTSELAPSSPPQVLHAAVVSPNSILVSWKPPSEPNGRITGYKIYFTTRPEDPLSSWLVARTQEERHHLTHLVPNATYYLKTNAYNAAGDGPLTETLPIIVTPGVPSAPSNFVGVATDPSTIHLQWKTPEVADGRAILGYQLRYRPATSDKSPILRPSDSPSTQTLTLGADATEYFLKGLEPSTLYYLSLAGRSENGLGIAAQIEVTTKDYLSPLPAPTGVHLRTLTTNSAKICWQRPDLPPTTNYTIGYELLFGTSKDASSPASATGVIPLPETICCCFTMMHLTPGTDYRVWLRFTRQPISVAANNRSASAPTGSWMPETKNRDLGPVSEPQAFRTSVTLPEMPQGQKILVHGPTAVQVTWKGPTKRLTEVLHYKLMWTCLDCPSSTVTGLQSETDTYYQDPARVGQRKVLANYGSSPDHVYTATIGELIPNASYQIAVAAANLRGVGQSFVFPVVRTRNQAPMKPKNLHLVSIHKRPKPKPIHPDQPAYLEITDPTYLSIELAWDPPDGLRTSQQITYQVFVRLVGPDYLITELTEQQPGMTVGDPGYGIYADHSLIDEQVTYHSGALNLHPLLRRRLLANVTGNTFRSTDSDGIAFGATYQFEVSLLNASVSSPSARLNVTTPDAPPSTSPLHVRLSGLSSSAVEISWAPPPVQYRNGRITAYQVRYFEVGAETQTETMAKVTVPGQRQHTAKDLKEKTFYTFMVRAFTSAGPGPWSGASNIRTSVELPPPPLDIRATRINQHQIKVTWRIPTGEELGAGSRHMSIQGFRLLYSSNNNPYEAGQWTSFDVAPITMSIISHLDSKTSYVICIKSRGPDGRYGDCSQPVISRAITTGSESEFSVRNLYCTGDETSVKVTWQQPIRTKQLEGFKVRVGGSKRFADQAGVMRTLEFPARSMSVAYAAIHVGYTCTVSDLEPNSIYDIQLSAYYEMTLDMESNWETTSCYTQMQRPPVVPPPLPVAASSQRRQVLLQLTRVSERFGKIRHYFLVIAPVHLADSEPEKIDIENTITTSRGLPSSGTRYVAARYQQDYFDPPPRRARNFTLGALIAVARAVRHTREEPSSTVLTIRNKRYGSAPTDPFALGMDAEVNFDNKVLVDGQEYKAFVRACVFQNDHPITTGPNACTSSDWSLGFGPDRKILPISQAVNLESNDYDELHDGQRKDRPIFGSGFHGNDLFVVAIVAVIVGLALVAVICIAFGCVMHRRRRPKLMNHLGSHDPSMKQPLMRMNDCGAPNGTNINMITSGIDLMASNMSVQNSTHLVDDKRDSYLTGHNSAPGSHILTASPPMGPQHASLFSSVTTAGRSGLVTSGTGSPMTGMDRLNHQTAGHVCSVPLQHTHPSTGAYPELTNIHTNMHPGLHPFVNSVRGVGALSSHTGSHPSSITGPPSAIGSGTGMSSNLNAGLGYAADSGGICDGLVIARNHLPGRDGGQEQIFDMQPLTLETKGPPMKHPIPINYLPDHVARLSAADNLLFSQEYESIETEQQFTWEHSNMEVNKAKNRYANVIAYDHSRVILQSIDCVPGSDYINANYIDGYKRPNAYIATQGPMPETYSDFWRMIWEQRVFIIVMMTRLEERSRIKCDQYWPTRGPESYAGGLLTVTPVDTVELAYYTIRTFNLTARGIDDECREVRHFQFTSWPDHGVPEYPVPLLLFIRRIRATVASGASSSSSNSGQPSMIEQGPIVVHCSAGVGRTGAFIVIDMMLERIKYEKTVDIYGCVRALRSQRNFMVQTEDQYIFIHSALLEVIDAGNTEVPARNLLAHIKKLRLLDTSGGSGMELEFKQLQQFRLPRAKYTSAQLPCNKGKNRIPTALPYESTRVTLQLIRGVEGSDYVNANFVDGYRERKAYIATQGPMAKTVEDFWRMVWEMNSTIVVMLTKLCERGRESCYPYWPSERSSRYQYYVVDPMVEYNMPNYTLREFKLTDARDGQSKTLRQFQFTDWPEQGVPNTCEPFIEFLGQVHKTKEQFGQDGPITVHCSNGIGRTGVFLTLSIILERMRYEGVVDMFQTVRMLRTQRPGLVETEEQYQFCYNAALAYLASFDHYAT